MNETAPRCHLVLSRGPNKGVSYPLEAGENLIGRWDPDTGAFPEIDLESEDPEAKVSRKHAVIRVSAARVTIEDIGSLNGTFVNRNHRLEAGEEIELNSGDEIIIGKTFLIFERAS